MIKGRSHTLGVVATFSLILMLILVAQQHTNIELTRRGTHRRVAETQTERDQQSRPAPDSAYTCRTNATAAFDASGKPCIDIKKAAYNQGIYLVNTDHLSYLYCSIPKNGCTYHLGIMQRLLGHDYEGGISVHHADNKYRLLPSPEAVRRMMVDPGIEKYMVVRNPLERVLSAYFDKVERQLPKDKRTPIVFAKWVYSELTDDIKNRSNTNPHWKRQIEFCGFSMRDLWKRFRWFRVERPVEYVDYLERLLPDWVTRDGWNRADNSSFRESVLGPRKRTGNTPERFYQYVPTVELFDYLAHMYQVDIERLGYANEVADMRKKLLNRKASEAA